MEIIVFIVVIQIAAITTYTKNAAATSNHNKKDNAYTHWIPLDANKIPSHIQNPFIATQKSNWIYLKPKPSRIIVGFTLNQSLVEL